MGNLQPEEPLVGQVVGEITVMSPKWLKIQNEKRRVRFQREEIKIESAKNNTIKILERIWDEYADILEKEQAEAHDSTIQSWRRKTNESDSAQVTMLEAGAGVSVILLPTHYGWANSMPSSFKETCIDYDKRLLSELEKISDDKVKSNKKAVFDLLESKNIHSICQHVHRQTQDVLSANKQATNKPGIFCSSLGLEATMGSMREVLSVGTIESSTESSAQSEDNGNFETLESLVDINTGIVLDLLGMAVQEMVHKTKVHDLMRCVSPMVRLCHETFIKMELGSDLTRELNEITSGFRP